MSEEIEDVIDHVMEEHPVKLTTKNVKWIITTIIVAIGAVYSLGIKTESFLNSMEVSKLETAHQEEKAKWVKEKMVLEKNKEEALLDADFYKNRYLISQKRLNACLEDKDFVNSTFNPEDNK